MRLPSPFGLIILILLLAGILLCGIALVPDQAAAAPNSPADPRRSSDPLVSDGLVLAKDSGRPSHAPPSPSFALPENLISDTGEDDRCLQASFPSSIDDDGHCIIPVEEWVSNEDVDARNLNSTMEELVHNTPIVKGSVVTIGSKTSSLYHVDAESGELLYKDHLPGTWLASRIHRVEEDTVSSKLSNGRSARTSNKIVTIIRTDYRLNSSKLGKPLWSMHISTISAGMNLQRVTRTGQSSSWDS